MAKLFEVLKVPVYYADQASKGLYTSDTELAEQIKKHFGEEIYEGGQFQKEKLSAQVFNDPKKLELLNQLVHPPTIRAAEAWMAAQTAPYVVKEAALIFESGSQSGLDLVIGVSAPEHLRISRAMKRDGISREEVMKRMRRQVDEKIKMSLCDAVIINNEQEAVIPQVLELHKKLLDLALRRSSKAPR